MQITRVMNTEISAETTSELLQCLGDMFYGMYHINLVDNYFEEITTNITMRKALGKNGDARAALELAAKKLVKDGSKKVMAEFNNFDTIAERLSTKPSVTCHFEGITAGWTEATLIASKRNRMGDVTDVLLVFRSIQDEVDAREESQKQIDSRNRLIDTLMKEYDNVFLIDVETRDYNYITVNGRPVAHNEDMGDTLEHNDADVALATYLDRCVFEDDKDMMRPFLQVKSLNELTPDEGGVSRIYRRLFSDGSIKFFQLISMRFVGADGGSKLVICFRDVNESITAQKKNEEGKVKLALLGEAAKVLYPFIIQDNITKGIVLDCYNAIFPDAPDIEGLSLDQMLKTVATTIPNDDQRELFYNTFKADVLLQAHDRGENIIKMRLKQMYIDEPHWVEQICVLIDGDDGDVYSISMVRTIDEELKRNRELEDAKRRAERDALSGLLNHGAFQNLMNLYKYSDEIAIILIDIDSFKDVNDTYGHVIGDEVIKYVAECIKLSFRSSDFICRTGGDEFAIIMTGIDKNGKPAIVSKLDYLMKTVVNKPDLLPDITLSVGIAMATGMEYPDSDELFKSADRAMYYVKEHGKDGYKFV